MRLRFPQADAEGRLPRLEKLRSQPSKKSKDLEASLFTSLMLGSLGAYLKSMAEGMV